MNLIKKTAMAFTLIGIFSMMLYGQAKNRVARLPAEWSLTLKDEGAPWENKVELQLSQDGTLVVIQQNAEERNRIIVPQGVKQPENSVEESSAVKVPKVEEMPDKSISKRTVKLRAREAREIYVQAWKAFRAFRFPEKRSLIADGTHLTLQLRATGRVLEIQVFNIAEIEKETPELARLFALMEKYFLKAN